ncbi:MAG: response regulator [Chlorobiaceae bacterium]|nr:response regulator [Chlorobiaceae bacterium]
MQKLKSLSKGIIEHAEPNLGIIGIFTTLGYPVYYIIWTYLFPQPYENLALRMFCAVISIPCILHRQIPVSVKKFFPLYFYFTFFIDVPYFFSFMLLKNECSIIWTMSLLTGIFMLILILSNWMVVSIMTILGFMTAYATVMFLDGEVSFAHFQLEYIPIFLFSFFGSIIANHNRQLANQTKISLLKSLSGSIAHEMRNPLNAITNAIGSVQATLPKKTDINTESESYSVSYSCLMNIHQVIEESSNTLNRANKIIDSILTSMRGGEVSTGMFIRISVADAVEEAVSNFPFNDAEEKMLVSINKIQNFNFLGDRDLFHYVLFNLLKNSLYYKNKKNFCITITTDSTLTENTIKFRDTGPGIPANKRELVFDSFYTSDKKGGNGLGLSFCRRVIDAFGGTIVCNSKEGEWTEFIITLPKYDSKKVKEIKKRILQEKRVLITDDQPGNRLLLSKFLSETNCQYEIAENSTRAIEMLSEKRYDLIFMEFETHALNDVSAVRFIRSAEGIAPALAIHYLDVPVIGLTSLPREKALEQAGKCGINEVITKPVKKTDIRKIIEKYFFSGVQSIRHGGEELISGKRILLVDDNETSVKFMSIMLDHFGCNVDHAIHGKEAIDLLEKEDFDLVLMDLEMPVMGGIEATRVIREGTRFNRFRSFKTIPIIALTGNDDEQNKENIKNAGMNHHLCKPVFTDALISAITLVLNNESDEKKTIPANKKERPVTSRVTFWNTLNSENILDAAIINSLIEIGGEELLESLVESFSTDTDKLIGKLEESVAAKELKQFDFTIHTLKGSSGCIGAHKMFVLCRYINEYSRKGEWPDNSTWLEILKTVYAETKHELQILINPETTSSS